MTKRNDGLIAEDACPHPGCTATIRVVHNRATNAIYAYHGEDRLAQLTIARTDDAPTGNVMENIDEIVATDPGAAQAIQVAMAMQMIEPLINLHLRRTA